MVITTKHKIVYDKILDNLYMRDIPQSRRGDQMSFSVLCMVYVMSGFELSTVNIKIQSNMHKNEAN